MIVFPKAKINLGLRITGKRSDGYHDIETVFYSVGLSDALEYIVAPEKTDKDILIVTGINTGVSQDDNLVIKTVKRIRKNYPLPYLKIHLHKVIPLGAGLGGGSSDAANLLRLINRCFSLSIEEQELINIALELGSDCPFFIDGTPAYATGRGDILEAVRNVLSGYYLVLLNPGIGINTKEAYQHCHPVQQSVKLNTLIDRPVNEWKKLIINDFEEFAFKEHPVISIIKNDLYEAGAIFSLMSGSGSSVYGVFQDKPELPVKLNSFVIWKGLL